jgi:hypothetical protein
MPWGFAAAAVATVGSAYMQSEAAEDAANAQMRAGENAQETRMRMFNLMRSDLKPYREMGEKALTSLGDLMGLGGQDAQAAFLADIQKSPEFTSMLQQGENAMLQNASATGGLRGGNLQGALAQFRPALLSQQIQTQYSRLGGLANIGQSSSAQTGAAGIQTGQGIASDWGTIGAAQAGGYLGEAKAWSKGLSDLSKIGGMYFGGASG